MNVNGPWIGGLVCGICHHERTRDLHCVQVLFDGPLHAQYIVWNSQGGNAGGDCGATTSRLDATVKIRRSKLGRRQPHRMIEKPEDESPVGGWSSLCRRICLQSSAESPQRVAEPISLITPPMPLCQNCPIRLDLVAVIAKTA